MRVDPYACGAISTDEDGSSGSGGGVPSQRGGEPSDADSEDE
jgi:hypothetical protein